METRGVTIDKVVTRETMIIIEVKEKVLAVVWTNLITKTPPTNSFISTPQAIEEACYWN